MRVAVTLGWTQCNPDAESTPWEFHDEEPRIRVGLGIPPGGSERREIPHFTRDWSAIGPLIEKYGITLVYVSWIGPPSNSVRADPPYWEAIWDARDGWDGLKGDRVDAPTPLLAVCNLILKMKEAGGI